MRIPILSLPLQRRIWADSIFNFGAICSFGENIIKATCREKSIYIIGRPWVVDDNSGSGAY